MNEQQQHAMVLQKTHSSGAEEWYCPICGRRMTITWQPWKKIILEPGDIYAVHSGSKGGIHVGSLEVNEQNNEDCPPSAMEPIIEDPYLAPWQQWLDEVDYDDLWNLET